MRVLNLYAGVGGNHELWKNYDITAVELNPEIASVYKNLYPNDNIVVDNAMSYLLQHYKEFDFVWASPPCQSHSRMRQFLQVNCRGQKAVYPDMSLYQIIIFLQNNFKGKFVVENVKPYYVPLLPPRFELQRHLYWSNFLVEKKEFKQSNLRAAQIPELQEYIGIDLSEHKLKNKRQVLRNCVLPEIGNYILQQALLKKNEILK